MLGGLAYQRGVRLSEHELEDLAHETLTRVVAKLRTFRGDATVETWVYEFCKRQLMNEQRKHRRRPQPLDDLVEEPVAPDVVPPEGAEMQRFLKHLTEREAEVVDLRFAAGHTLEEIAARLEVSPSTVKTCYYRAMSKLRQVFKDGDEGGAR